jgi:hypothetical protein
MLANHVAQQDFHSLFPDISVLFMNQNIAAHPAVLKDFKISVVQQ